MIETPRQTIIGGSQQQTQTKCKKQQKKQKQTLVTCLGEGQEANVYGIFTYPMIQSILASASDVRFLTDKSPLTDRFILKVHKRKISCNNNNNQDKELQEIHKVLKYQSILLPIATGKVNSAWFHQNPFIEDTIERPENDFFAIEVQEYGGHELFALNADPRIRFTMDDIVHIWISILYIFLDALIVIHRLEMFMTDVKIENMVWDGHRLRLIDVHFYPMPWIECKRMPLVITPRIDVLPSQYFDKAWPKIGPPGYLQKYFHENSKNILKSPLVHKHVVASDSKQRKMARESCIPPEEEKIKLQRHALMFVVYPILIWFGMMLERDNKIQMEYPDDKQSLDELKDFCAKILEERGRTLKHDLLPMLQFSKQWIPKIYYRKN